MLPLAGLVATATAYYSESALLQICILCCTALFAFALSQDMRAALTILLRLSSSEQARSRFKPFTPRTSLGCAMAERLQILQHRHNTLLWEIETHAKPELNLTKTRIAETSTEEREFFEKALAQIKQKFRADTLAVVFMRDDSLHLITHGVSGERFSKYLIESCKPYLLDGDRSRLGVCDSLRSESMFGDFSAFGYRYTLAAEFKAGTDASDRGVLWLGYDREAMPTKSEADSISTICDKLESEVIALYQVKTLSKTIDQAIERDRAKDQFIAYMSHDLRTPLNNVRSIVSLLKIEGSPSDAGELCQAALSNCDQMGDLVQDILDFSKHQAGQLKAKREAIDAVEALQHAVQCFRPQAISKGLELLLDCAVDELLLDCDPRHLRRVIANVLSNAIKYTDRGRVVVFVRPISERTATIVIADTGTGMSSDQIARIFNPFSRFDTTRNTAGVGLGMALSKALIELSEGTISVESTPGKGSTFQIKLPLASQTELLKPEEHVVKTDKTLPVMEIVHSDELLPSITAAQTNYHLGSDQNSEANIDAQFRDSDELQPSASTFTVLVVDDDRDMTRSLARSLQHAGFRTMAANSIRDALAVLNFEPPSAIITDSRMPNGGGKRIVRVAGKLIPVLILSGSDTTQEQLDYQRLGAHAYFAKPCPIERIIEWVSAVSSEHESEIVVQQSGGGSAS